MKKLFLVLGLSILLLVAVLLIRTLIFASSQMKVETVKGTEVPESAITHLQKAIQFKTISNQDPTDFDSIPFIQMNEYIAETYPLIDSILEKKTFNYSLLYKWDGKNSQSKPVILMGHLDVVPVDETTLEDWEAGPFSGDIIDGKIIGRGSLDDKVNVIATIEACEKLLSEGFQPERTIYFAFGHDEEIGGENGAKLIAEYLNEQKIEAEFVLDEGGFIAQDMIPGISSPLAVVNTGEKGYVSYEISLQTPGGHSSNPPVDNTIGSLATIISTLEKNQFPYRMMPILERQIAKIGPEFPFAQRIAFANTWLFGGQILKALNAHTTIAPTMISGGVKDNVIPTKASVVVNFRIMPGESVEDVKDHIMSTIKDDRISIKSVSNVNEPSAVSNDQNESFKLIEKTIRQLFPNTIVSPGLLGAGTDSKHFLLITDNVYRFFPTRVDPSNVTGFHGINEHILVDNYKETVQFAYQLIRNLN